MKLEIPFENENQEFKTSLAELDKGILSLSAMLNKSGKGKLYFGVANDGTIIGLNNNIGEETLKKIGKRIHELILPHVVPKVSFEFYNNSTIIVVEAQGYNKPYSCKGEYRIRVASEDKQIEPDVMNELIMSNSLALMDNAEAINQNPTFEQLKSLYISHKLSIDNKTFFKNTGLLTKNGKFNYLAEILSDNNNCSIKVVRFSGVDKTEMISRNEFGYQCLLIAMKKAYEYVISFNETRVDLSKGITRVEYPLFDAKCFDEAWTNACLHNRWIKNVPPAIYMFDDRIEIISTGGLPFDYSKEEFFMGVSRPVNIGLQKIMGQLNMIEQTGHGVPTIVQKYSTKAFEIGTNHIIVTIPFAYKPSYCHSQLDDLTKSQKAVFDVIKNNPTFTIKEISQLVGLGTTRVSQIIKTLKNEGKIKRVGATKGTYWLTI